MEILPEMRKAGESMSDMDLPLAVRMMQDGYLMQIDALQDENERLRSCLSDSAENSKQIMHEAHVQEEENAKLRELVRDFYPFASGRAAKPWLAVRLDRMRELGVEV